MDQISFFHYLKNNGTNQKVISDIVSRLKKIEYSIINCDLDEEHEKDCCKRLLSLFVNRGDNDEMKKVLIGSLPIGKPSINTYTYALKKYITFKTNKND